MFVQILFDQTLFESSMDLRPSIHTRESERLKTYPVTDLRLSPEGLDAKTNRSPCVCSSREYCKMLTEERKDEQKLTRTEPTPKPRGFFQKPQK